MNRIQCISPVDGSVYLERAHATKTQIETTLNAAKQAEEVWRNTTLDERIRMCQKALDYFVSNSEQIGEEISWQMGRPIRYSPGEINNGFAERAKHMMGIAQTALADQSIPNKPGFVRFVRKEPLGTVLVLAPWNYPYLTSVNVIIPALLAGNCVILKHSSQTPLCSERYEKAFTASGLPSGVFQYLHLSHSQSEKIVQDARINYVAFTGSVSGGHIIQRAARSRLITTGLELGGKDPAYVRNDCDLDHAVTNLVDGAYFNSGQSCCGIERIYVQREIFKPFVKSFAELTSEYQLGNPLDHSTTLGPMVSASAAKYVKLQIDQAMRMGAKGLIDSSRFPHQLEDSAYLAPQVLIDVNHKMDIMKEESFGPVVGIMTVESDDEALHWMNDSPYGLTASIWTDDIEAAIKLGDQIDTGTCYMNRCDYLDPELPWVGVKDSGLGCTLSAFGYNQLTRPKSFHLKHNLE